MKMPAFEALQEQRSDMLEGLLRADQHRNLNPPAPKEPSFLLRNLFQATKLRKPYTVYW